MPINSATEITENTELFVENLLCELRALGGNTHASAQTNSARMKSRYSQPRVTRQGRGVAITVDGWRQTEHHSPRPVS